MSTNDDLPPPVYTARISKDEDLDPIKPDIDAIKPSAPPAEFNLSTDNQPPSSNPSSGVNYYVNDHSSVINNNCNLEPWHLSLSLYIYIYLCHVTFCPY